MSERRRSKQERTGRTAAKVEAAANTATTISARMRRRAWDARDRLDALAGAAQRRASRYMDVAQSAASPAVRERAKSGAKRVAGEMRKTIVRANRADYAGEAWNRSMRITNRVARAARSPAIFVAAELANPDVANAGENEWVRKRDIAYKQRQVRDINARKRNPHE